MAKLLLWALKTLLLALEGLDWSLLLQKEQLRNQMCKIWLKSQTYPQLENSIQMVGARWIKLPKSLLLFCPIKVFSINLLGWGSLIFRLQSFYTVDVARPTVLVEPFYSIPDARVSAGLILSVNRTAQQLKFRQKVSNYLIQIALSVGSIGEVNVHVGPSE